MPDKAKLRAIKYLNNSMENDHKFTKSKSRYRQWYQFFTTARKTLDGMETMRMIQKGQVRNVGKNIKKQNNFICGLFGLAWSPRLLIPSNFFLLPLDDCLGTRPSQADMCLPFLNSPGLGIAATMAVAVNSPTPGILRIRRQALLCTHMLLFSFLVFSV